VDLDFIKNHIRNRPYMSGIERDKNRVKQTQECFTKDILVVKTCDLIEEKDVSAFRNPIKTFIDPTGCGDGQFLSEVLIRKIENGSTFEQALSTIYGVDLMPDNVKLCQDRLLCGQEQFRHIVEKNIVCADALRYHYRFDGSHPYDDEVKEQKKTDLHNRLFEIE
jgi:hypothetical protein